MTYTVFQLCQSCQSRFSILNRSKCGTCGKVFCPSCQGCDCTVSKRLKKKFSKKKTHFKFNPEIKFIKLEEISKLSRKYNLGIKGTLSPLERQRPVKLKHKTELLSEFNFEDDTGSIKLVIFGKLPRKIFNNRYKFMKVQIKGVRIKFYKEELQLIVQQYSEVQILNKKPLNLNEFLQNEKSISASA